MKSHFGSRDEVIETPLVTHQARPAVDRGAWHSKDQLSVLGEIRVILVVDRGLSHTIPRSKINVKNSTTTACSHAILSTSTS